MYIQIIQKVELNPETEGDLIKKYSKDNKWKLVYNSPEKVVYKNKLPKYESVPMYMPGTF